MTRNPRGRNNRARKPVLPTFLASDAPAALKTEVLDILATLEAYLSLDAALLRAEQPALLARVEALTPAGLELFRALRLQACARGGASTATPWMPRPTRLATSCR